MLEEEDYYKVPDFRQVDFYNNKILDKNINILKKNINRINNFGNRLNRNEYYVETKETKSGNSNLPIVETLSGLTSGIGSAKRSASFNSRINRTSSPFIKLKQEEEVHMRFEYNKIFSKKYQKILNECKRPNSKKKLRDNPSSNYLKDKIDEMRSKIYFIKSVYDYSYPQIMVQKLKTMKGIVNKVNNKTLQLEAQKFVKKKESDLDKLILIGHNYQPYLNNQIITQPKSNRLKYDKKEKFFKT